MSVTEIDMVRAFACVLTIGVTACTCAAANAASVANADNRAYQIRVIENGNKRTTHELSASGLLKTVCTEGCILRLIGVDDGVYTLEGTERTTIEGGLLYYDGPVSKSDNDRG